MSAADGEVGQRGQAEIKEARELVAKARHFETQRRRLAGAARPRGGAGRVVIDVAAVSVLGKPSSTRCLRLRRDHSRTHARRLRPATAPRPGRASTSASARQCPGRAAGRRTTAAGSPPRAESPGRCSRRATRNKPNESATACSWPPPRTRPRKDRGARVRPTRPSSNASPGATPSSRSFSRTA